MGRKYFALDEGIPALNREIEDKPIHTRKCSRGLDVLDVLTEEVASIRNLGFEIRERSITDGNVDAGELMLRPPGLGEWKARLAASVTRGCLEMHSAEKSFDVEPQS